MASIAEHTTDCKGFLGHNGGPPLSIRNFKRHWAEALFAHPKKPYGAIAMGFKLYMEMDSQGCGACISDDEFRASCGVSDGSCRTFKKWLLDNDFIHIMVRGQRGRKSTFQAVIPGEQIPAIVDAIPEEVPAAIAVNGQEYRQPLPSIETGIPATVAAIPQLPAIVDAISASAPRAPALIENPSGLVTYEESEEEVKKEKGKVGAADALEAFNRFNELALRVGLPMARTLTPERTRALIKRMNDNGGPSSWEALISNIERSQFLQGHNDRGWLPPGLDWFLKSANFTKVIEGAYGNGAHAEPKESEFDKIGRLVRQATVNQQRRLTHE